MINFNLLPLALLQQIPPPVSPLLNPFAPTDLIAVAGTFDALGFLKVNAVADGYLAPLNKFLLPFTAGELREIELLLPPIYDEEYANLVLTPRQSMLLYRYAAHYYSEALSDHQYAMADIYKEFMNAVFPGTLISFQR